MKLSRRSNAASWISFIKQLKSFCFRKRFFWPNFFFSSKSQVSEEGISDEREFLQREKWEEEKEVEVKLTVTWTRSIQKGWSRRERTIGGRWWWERQNRGGGGGGGYLRRFHWEARGVTRRQISCGGRTSSKITGEPRSADSTQASAQSLCRQG